MSAKSQDESRELDNHFALRRKSPNLLKFSECAISHPLYLSLNCWLKLYCRRNTQKKVKDREKERERGMRDSEN